MKMIQIKYAIRQVNVQAHSKETYLCKHDDGVYFSYAYPTDLFFFDRKEDAVDYIKIKDLKFCEIIEVYHNEN